MISPHQYEIMKSRLGKKDADATLRSVGEEPPRESKLHDKIMEHCNAQWPRWKFIRARMDRKSTIGVGVHDFTIFMPGEKVLCVECKKPGGKLDKDQNIWAHEMAKNEHKVHVVTSYNEFTDVLQRLKEGKP